MKFLNGSPVDTAGSAFTANRAFLCGDAVTVFFFIREGKIFLGEECYFFLMASMRKMRMKIPMDFTLEFFTEMFYKDFHDYTPAGIIRFMVFRNRAENFSAKTPVQFYYEIHKKNNSLLKINEFIKIDILKEIWVNTHILDNLHTHCPENSYAEIYAKENDLDDIILLNPNKRIARTVFGNLLFLEGNTLKVPKQSEGAYISPLLEALVSFIHKNRLAEIEQTEMLPFESQKADEILLVSDEKGFQSVKKIRNKTFGNQWFTEILEKFENEI